MCRLHRIVRGDLSQDRPSDQSRNARAQEFRDNHLLTKLQSHRERSRFGRGGTRLSTDSVQFVVDLVGHLPRASRHNAQDLHRTAVVVVRVHGTILCRSSACNLDIVLWDLLQDETDFFYGQTEGNLALPIVAVVAATSCGSCEWCQKCVSFP